jgi:hypothetical protein
VVNITEVNMSTDREWQVSGTSSGSETMACRTLRICGNPGDPLFSCCESNEYAGQLIIKGEWQMERGKSDGIIVPMKAGNSAGGKDVT